MKEEKERQLREEIDVKNQIISSYQSSLLKGRN
jgi:hypothetical protein